MKKVYLFAAFFVLTLHSFTQESSIGIQFGSGSFAMYDFKNLNNSVQHDLPFKSKITDNFPMFMVFKVYYLYSISGTFGIGLKCSFSSTGSLISREDYSGTYYFKNQVNFASPGLIFDYCISTTGKIRILLYDEIGWEFSDSKMHENLTTSGNNYDFVNEYRSINKYFEPGFKIVYPYKDKFYFGIYTGYLIDLKGELKDGGSSYELKEFYDISKVPFSFNWTGIRFGVMCSIKISE
jgi:hypothetical protein